MDPRLLALCATYGVFLTREALALGYDDKTIARAVRHKLWYRIRRGAYTAFATWNSADDAERHRIRCKAVMRSLGDRVALSHVSNLVMRGIDVWNVDLAKVHVTRLDGGPGRTEHDIVHHEGLVGFEEVERVDGILMIRPDRAVAESLTLCAVEEGLVMADSALHRKLISRAELENAHQRIAEWPFIRSAQIVVPLADGRAESPGETRVRYICWEQALPAPELQFEVYDEHGELFAVTDFLWRKQRALGEFDGRGKYGRLLRPGQTAQDAVFAEKVREERVCDATGMGMVRLIWADLDDHVAVARRIRSKFH